MTTKFKILSSISFIALAIVLTFVGVWALTDLDFAVGGNITYTAPAPEPVTPEEVSYLTFEYYDDLTAKLTACSTTAPETVEIPSQIVKNGKTYTVTSIAEGEYDEGESEAMGLFYGTVKEIVISDTVTDIGQYAFSYAYLNSVTIGAGVKNWSEAFSFSSIDEIIIKKGVTIIPALAFDSAMGALSISIPDSVTSIEGWAFISASIKEITLPSSVTSIGDSAFWQCYWLENITLKSTTPPTLGSDVFVDCSSLATIKVPAESLEAYKTAENWSEFADIMVGV